MGARESLRDNGWGGEKAFVVGGGESLKSLDWKLLKGVGRVIAINRAFAYLPWADVMISEDERFFKRFASELNQFEGHKVFATPDDSYVAGVMELVPEVEVMRSAPKAKGWPRKLEEGLSTSSNSGVPAMNLADIMGASEIYLVGFDFKGKNFHVDYPEGWGATEEQLKSFESDFKWWVAPHMRHRKVINLNLDSGLDCFPKLDRDGFLCGLR